MHRIFCAFLLFQIFAAALGRLPGHLFSPISPNSPFGSNSVIHGDVVEVNEITYIVDLYFWSYTKKEWRHRCGGGIIGKSHILTAAHCLLSESNRYIIPGLFVMAGIVDSYAKDVERYGVPVTKAYLPKKYRRGKFHHRGYKIDHFYPGDIAVLKLNGDLDLNSNTKLNLPPAKMKNTYEGVEAFIAGFGVDELELEIYSWKETIRKTRNSGKLHKKIVIVRDFITKKASKRYFRCYPAEEYICAVTKERSLPGGICGGDSGSPLVYDNTVIGIASVVDDFCDQLWMPAAYTRVSTYVDFIDDAMNDRITDSMHVHEW